MTTTHEPGGKSSAICEGCARVVPTTFLYRDVPFSDGVGVARDVLAAVCDECNEVVAIPAQSVPIVIAARALSA